MTTPAGISAAQAQAQGFPEQLITTASEAHPKPQGSKFTYGTAGIRTKANTLDSVCFRMGLVAALRSKSLGGKNVGVMVTASHNPEEDNGLKMVDPRGEMLLSSWEPHCTTISNAASSSELISSLKELISTFSIDLDSPASVIVGHDTRPSCPSLVQALVDGLAAMGSSINNQGLKTTPQLHYLVKATNTKGTKEEYGEPTEEGYYKKLAKAFEDLVSNRPAPKEALLVDCANGVGAPALTSLLKHIPSSQLLVEPLRTSISTPGALNSGCGADHVKTTQSLPSGFSSEKSVLDSGPGVRMCSFDGDADRIVYYYLCGAPDKPGSFRLLDGDKIAGLASDFISELVKEAKLEKELKVGCVQTAYANGSSTKYLEERVPVTCTPTGVKHLHHAAESFDIGVYFEANGHGTVLFSEKAVTAFKSSADTSPAAKSLLSLSELINQTVGDAISDMLLVETILRHRGWTATEWDSAYEDLPNKLLKVNVKDRTIFKTTDAERKLTSPEGLQSKIDQLVKKYQGGRSFVRPSGTEDCVRVYAEAKNKSDMEALAEEVRKVVEESG